MDDTPSKPNGNDAPDRPDQSLRDETHPGGRIAGQRVTPQSPNEALQPAAAPPPPIPPSRRRAPKRVPPNPPTEPSPPPPPPPPPTPPSRRRPALSAFSGFLSFLLIA